MIAPADTLTAYDGATLDPALRNLLWDDPRTVAAVLGTLDPLAGSPVELTEAEVAQIIAFLEALTDPAAADMAYTIPDSVPSGLPVLPVLPALTDEELP